MTDDKHDAAIIQVLAERLETQRLPMALSLKKQVDRGETLTEFDIRFLREVFEDAYHIHSLLDRHPEWQPLAAQLIHLYKEITEKALLNENARRGNK